MEKGSDRRLPWFLFLELNIKMSLCYSDEVWNLKGDRMSEDEKFYEADEVEGKYIEVML